MHAATFLLILLFALLLLRVIVIGNREHLAHWKTPWAAERELALFLVLWPAMLFLDAWLDGEASLDTLLLAIGRGAIIAFATYGAFMLMYRIGRQQAATPGGRPSPTSPDKEPPA